jgi:ATP-dependent helicase/nuclease subunit A
MGSGKPDPKSSRTNVRFLFAKSEQEIEAELSVMLPVISRLLETVILTDDHYKRLKHSENAIDFSDYEHLALLILDKEDAKAYYSSQFDEIYIDEYQDNSRIQEAIVDCFSRENCFAVGDVKQSIYRFRHARPQIFLSRMKQYKDQGTGVVRELNSNYRSDPRILSAINDIFEQVMSQASGEIDYDSSQQLTPGIEESHTFDDTPAVELLLLDVSKRRPPVDEEMNLDQAGEITSPNDPSALIEDAPVENSSPEETDTGEIDPEKTQKEARLVAAKIKELSLIEGVSWSDFAILCRKNLEVEIFTAELNAAGIPAEGKKQDEYLSSRELLLMENLVRLLDNFNQDIPLAAVMRANFPQSGFTDEELLRIKLDGPRDQSNNEYFYQAVLFARFKATDKALREKVESFCDWIDSLRSASMYLRVSELIERIYYETGYREQVSALENGNSRVMALEAFRDWAGRFDTGRSEGLYRFVSYMQDLRERQESPEEFIEEQLASDVVRCMTIHKSKGLEFRVVFLTGIGKSFMSRESAKQIMLSETFGVATGFIDPDEGLYYETHLSMAVEDEERNAELSEQMRVLYVALTRAQEKLFLTSCFERNKDGVFSSADYLIRYAMTQRSTILPAWLVKKSKSFLDLCLLAFARNPGLDFRALLSQDDSSVFYPDPAVAPSRSRDIGLSIIDYESIRKGSPVIETQIGESRLTETPVVKTLSEQDKRLFNMQCEGKYPYEALTQAPSKITVSELKRRAIPKIYLIEEQDTDALVSYPPSKMRPINLSVRFSPETPGGRKEILSATERGTLLHSVFQYLDISRIAIEPDMSAVDSALQAMVDANMLRRDRLIHIDPYKEAIRTFAESDICRRILAAESRAKNGPYREIPFSLAMTVESKDDICMVQGMIDCWFIEDSEAVLIDYKTDVLRGTYDEKMAILSERYATQLDYYARAITSASGLPVKERIIWLIPDAASFPLEAPGRNS